MRGPVGAKIYAELTGFGMSGDAHHITAPAESGDGAARCMSAALSDSQLNPDDIDYINAPWHIDPAGRYSRNPGHQDRIW